MQEEKILNTPAEQEILVEQPQTIELREDAMDKVFRNRITGSHSPETESPSVEPIANESPEKEKDYLKELNIAKERLQENQNYARSAKRSLSFINKALEESASKINEFVDNGDLSEDQAKSILAILKSKNVSEKIKEPAGLSDKIENEESSHPFERFYNIANKDVLEEYIEQAADNDEHESQLRNQIKDQIRAYDYFIQEASQEELESLYEEFSKAEDKPMRLLKKMLSVGNKFMDEGFSDFNKSGGIRKYLKEKSSEFDRLNKEVDKLRKELSKYKMYDSPTYNLRESTGNKSQLLQTADPVDRFLENNRRRG